jgi:salicylate hydroxylase
VHIANKKKAANVGKEVTDEDLRSLAVNRPDTVWLHEHDVVKAFEEVVHRNESGKDAISARL